MRSLTVPPNAGPVRLDVFLARHVPECSRRIARHAIIAGAVRINGRRARKGDLVANHDVVEVTDDLFTPATLQPNPQLVLGILYEDDVVIAVDKPSGMPSHALRPEETGTVANFLLARHPDMALVGRSALEAGVVHRLDTDTSGVLLAARTDEAYRLLRQQFSRREVSKEYMAVVEGEVGAAGAVRAALVHHPRNRRRMTVCAQPQSDRHAREAVTYYQPIERARGATLLRVQIPTGVMHQIRVHLASIGHPVMGDRLYGSRSGGAPRHLLHASRLRIVHPRSGEPLEITSPLPADFQAVWRRLRGGRIGAADS